MEKITLSHKWEVNGKRVREISYDPAKLTVVEYQNALKRLKPAPGQMSIAINDYALHLELGKEIILATNKEKGFAIEDFDRLICSDIWKVQAVGMRFFGGTPEEQTEDNSEEPSSNTPTASTPPKNS